MSLEPHPPRATSATSARLRSLCARVDLSAAEMGAAIGGIMDGQWTAAQSGAFLGALATKGETAEELIGAATAMRERGRHVDHALETVVDLCGTGGDGAGTINVSTCASIVVAACGVNVAKHGNRAASSRSGSADVLEAAGVRIDESPEQARVRLETGHFAFLFAQHYHPSMRAVAPVRRELRVRTVFNLLGPLTNPARATHQVIGVASEPHVALVGAALRGLGASGGAVVHAMNGIDEIAGDVPTHIFEFGPAGARRYLLDPADFGISASLAALAGGDPAHNATALRLVLEGERSGRADVIALNAAFALTVARSVESIREGLGLARASIRSGAALALFESLRRPVPRAA